MLATREARTRHLEQWALAVVVALRADTHLGKRCRKDLAEHLELAVKISRMGRAKEQASEGEKR